MGAVHVITVVKRRH